MRQLLPLDDHKIRKQAFAEMAKLLKRLQRMEDNLEAFEDQDQRLFNEWMEVTFRERRRVIEELRGEYRRLADLHNWAIAMKELDDLTLGEAAYLLEIEEERYRTGSPETRARIEQERGMRDAFIERESEREALRAQRRRQAREEQRQTDAPPPPEPEDIEHIQNLASLPDDQLEDWCAEASSGSFVLAKALRIAFHTEDYKPFLRLWDHIHPKFQQQFARRYQSATGGSLFDIIEEGRLQADAPKVQDPSPSTEAFKLLYRQLARKLHPDMHGDPERKAGAVWRAKFWLKVTDAYQKQDARQLAKLHHLVLLREGDYNSLRLSELSLTRKWLNDEIGQAESRLRGVRRNPAWGFSRRKDYTAVEIKVKRDFDKQRARLEADVNELRMTQAYWRRLGRQKFEAEGD